MPIFEFECQACGTPFEELVRNAAVVEVACPKCGSQKRAKDVHLCFEGVWEKLVFIGGQFLVKL